ncbi:S-adenosyl-L-methionine-dependent methyltransferase [Paraphysoderma sedebokerense]|nr:S-adenosyl-L-methionine-dependent methyltransferase [Paraphysoderma sedebokerense]
MTVETLDVEYSEFWQTSEINARNAKRTTVPVPPYPVHGAGFHQFSSNQLWAVTFGSPAVLLYLFSISLKWYPIALLLLGFPAFALNFYMTSQYMSAPPSDIKLPGKPLEEYMEIKDPELRAKYHGYTKIPIETAFEAYFDGKLDFKGDIFEVFERRYDWASFNFTASHVKFFLTQWIPETIWHSRKQDADQVREHYDRGDDFYAGFLGPRMIYTSGNISNPDKRESLEELQDNKLELVSKLMKFKPGDRHLDIGCGWGTLAVHAAKNYGTQSTGVTLGRNQTEFGSRRAKENGVENNVNILCMDYRDIPKQKFDKITCLEMAEHVGVRKFQDFLVQVREMMEDDGLFYLQIAGLRSFEDFNWGLFMAKYIFPGADASCPLNWVINQLEYAGFEVQTMDTIGVHYSATIERWYRNWQFNRARLAERYDERWIRVWEIFLAWSSIIARQGSATCYQIVAHKNTNKFNRVGLTMKKVE